MRISNAGKTIRSRAGILCTMEIAEGREMDMTVSHGEVPLLKSLKIILMLIVLSPREKQGC